MKKIIQQITCLLAVIINFLSINVRAVEGINPPESCKKEVEILYTHENWVNRLLSYNGYHNADFINSLDKNLDKKSCVNQIVDKIFNSFEDNIKQTTSGAHEFPISDYAELRDIYYKQGIAAELAKLEKMFPQHEGDDNLLLQDYQKLVLKIRTNISPKVTDILREFHWGQNTYLRLKPFKQYDSLGQLVIDDLGLSKLENTAKYGDEVAAVVIASIKKRSSVVNPVVLIQYNEIVKKYNSILEQNKNYLSQLTILESFIKLSAEFQRQAYRGNSGGGFGDYSSVDVLAGSGGLGSGSGSGSNSGSLISTGGRILYCYENTCVDAKHLIGDYFYTAYDKGYLVIERETLRHVYFTTRLLAQIIKEKSCYEEELTKLKWKQGAIAAGKSTFWTAATFIVGTGDTIVGVSKSIWNKKFDFSYRAAGMVYDAAIESVSRAGDPLIIRKLESHETESSIAQKLKSFVSELVRKQSSAIQTSVDYRALTCTSKLNSIKENYKDNL